MAVTYQAPPSMEFSGKSTGEGCHFLLLTNIWVTSIKNLPAIRETLVQSLDWVNLLEKGMATHPSIFAWKIHGQRRLVGYSPWGRKELDRTEWETLSLFFFFFILLSTETLPYVKSLLLHVFLRNSQGISHILSIRVLFYSAQAPTLYYTYLYLIENLWSKHYHCPFMTICWQHITQL